MAPFLSARGGERGLLNIIVFSLLFIHEWGRGEGRDGQCDSNARNKFTPFLLVYFLTILDAVALPPPPKMGSNPSSNMSTREIPI